jgi:CheY-like chemotaxis protein
LLGVPAQTLRTWQERYGGVVPERSKGGHRLYSREQLAALRFLAEQVAAGLSPGDAHRLLRERLAAPEPGPHDGRARILVAERDRHAAEFTDYFLCAEGYHVDLVRTADDALARVAAEPPDLVVVDLLISAGRGRALCAELAERTGLPILAISALALSDDALPAGAMAFMRKPIDPPLLAATVGDLLTGPAVSGGGPAAPVGT